MVSKTNVSNKKVKRPKSTIAKPKLFKQISKYLDFNKKFRNVFLREKKGEFGNHILEYIAEIMLLWAKDTPERYDFFEFLNLQDIPYNNLSKWEARCEKLADAKVITFQIIAANREREARKSSPDGVAFKHMQGFYSPQWKDREKSLAKLKAMSDSSGVTKNDLRDIVKDILKPVPAVEAGIHKKDLAAIVKDIFKS